MSFFSLSSFVQKKISLGHCDLFEYNRAKWGTSFYIEMTDKEVLATTKASKVSTKGVGMWAEDKSPVEFDNTTAKLFECVLCRSFNSMVHQVWQHGECASHSISNQSTNPRTAVDAIISIRTRFHLIRDVAPAQLKQQILS